MPTINGEITVTAEMEFEVFCTCGAGICGNVEVRRSTRRGMPQINISACEDCIAHAKNAVREQLEEKIEELTEIVKTLEKELEKCAQDS